MTKFRILNDFRARLLRSLRREDGQVIVMVALGSLVLFGAIGLAVDVGRMYIMKAELSRAMDAAALAGVLELPDAAKAIAACEEYLLKNEPDILPVGGPDLCTSPGENTLQVRGRKEMTMFFIRVLGINDAAVTGKAKAGFGVAFLDAALVIDSTSSMADTCNGSQNNSGCPIWEAKNAAKSFKDVLLGPSPDGNTSIGVAAFRGCYRDDGNPSNNSTAPMPSTKTNCILHDASASSQVIPLLSNATTLNTKIDALSALGGSGTNVCGGMLKAWEVLNGPGNHQGQQNSLKYMIVLSDGDNNYNGAYSYQSSPYASPHTYNSYSCQPPSSCSNVGGDSSGTEYCHSGVQTVLATVASDNFGSTSTTSITDGFDYTVPPWTGGSGWLAGWVPSSSDTTVVGTNATSPQAGSRRLLLGRLSSPVTPGNIYRTFSLTGKSAASLSYYARRAASFSLTDTVCVQVSTDNINWTNLHRFGSGTCPGTGAPANTAASSSAWTQYTDNIDTYAGQATVYVRFYGLAMDNVTDQFYFDTVNISTTSSCPGWSNTTAGTWAGAWTISPSSGNDMPQTPTSGTPFDTTCHAMLRGVGTITRTVDLTGVTVASLSYYAKRTNWEGGETVLVQASSNGTTWTTLRTISTSNLTNNTYTQFTEDLFAFAGANTYIRFAGNMTADAIDDQFYIDTVLVQSGAASANGYLNGQDAGPSCSGTAAKRERQLDLETYDLSKALKTDGVEIYVVAFGVCATNSTVYTEAQCDAQVGNTDADNTGDQRLMKCVSSSKPSTNDHYFYASSSGGLPAIFTQIAKQIAHRLIE